jgi:hypothetical protein
LQLCNPTPKFVESSQNDAKWFLSRKEFKIWMTPSRREPVLFYMASPRSGKSFLMKTVVDIMRENRKRLLTPDVVYVFCAHHIILQAQHSSAGKSFLQAQASVFTTAILRSLIAQMITINSDLLGPLRKIAYSLPFRNGFHLMNLLQDRDMKPEILWDFLRYAMELQRNREIIIIIDGLDTLDIEERIAFVCQLCRLRDLSRSAKRHSSRILVSSRTDEQLIDFLVEVPLLDERVELLGEFLTWHIQISAAKFSF